MRPALLEKPLLGRLVAGQVWREELDRHLPFQPRVLGRVDDPHPAVAEFGTYHVRAECRTWFERHKSLRARRLYLWPPLRGEAPETRLER